MKIPLVSLLWFNRLGSDGPSIYPTWSPSPSSNTTRSDIFILLVSSFIVNPCIDPVPNDVEPIYQNRDVKLSSLTIHIYLEIVAIHRNSRCSSTTFFSRVALSPITTFKTQPPSVSPSSSSMVHATAFIVLILFAQKLTIRRHRFRIG